MIGEYKIHGSGGRCGEKTGINFGGNIYWLNIFIGIWQTPPK